LNQEHPEMMTYNAILLSLIEGLNAKGEAFVQNWDVVQTWPNEALNVLLKTGLLTQTSVAKSLECDGCEYRCFSEVIISKNNSNDYRAFIVCEEPEMQNQMGKVEVLIERLKQWKTSAKLFACVIATLLKIEKPTASNIKQNSIHIGMLKGKKGRRLINLAINPLSLEINRHAVSLNEILFFKGKNLAIDHDHIDALINDDSKTKEKSYSPSTSKRELSKFKTQAMHQDWKDEYLKLKKEKPNATDSWCSKKIAKMDIAQERDSETIRKNMKE